MNVIKVTAIEYDKSILSNSTNDYNNITNNIKHNCTNNENNTDITILIILITIPFGLSCLCLVNLMVYTMIKPVKSNKC